MSRIPQPSSSRTSSSLKPPSTPTRPRVSSTLGSTSSTGSTKVKTQPSTARATTPKPNAKNPVVRSAVVEEPSSATPAMSIKDIIALKRAEAKKAQQKSGGGLGGMSALEDALPDSGSQPEEEDLLGRLPTRDTIEKARTTGVLNLATRSLPCLPSALFEIHLNIKPDPLKSVPDEPVLPPLEANPRRRGNHQETTWFEAQDLTVLKAWNNEIAEIQHEISMFGSLKTVDLHKNRLTSLPNSFADLTALTTLDLSHNALTSLPENIWALPQLTVLNISHNQLTELPFNAGFSAPDAHKRANQYTSSGFFTPAISRAIKPLPHLVVLDASCNKISAGAIHHEQLPTSLTKINLSENPLGESTALFRVMGSLKRLKEARFEKAQLGDDSFPSDLFSSTPFVALRLLDMTETQVNLEAVQGALRSMSQTFTFDFTNEQPPEGVTRILVGKRVMKEAWELQLERQSKAKQTVAVNFTDDWDKPDKPAPAARSNNRTSTVSPTPAAASKPPVVAKPAQPKKETVKEAWEIEAEQGLLTEGGKRRARAAAAAASQNSDRGATSSPVAASPSPPPASSPGLSSPQYYNATSQTLTLPASAPPTKVAGHGRSFSVATSSVARSEDLSVPTPTLPLSVIVSLPFVNVLRVLNLSNRRMDKSFALPTHSDSISGFLPVLEELNLEGCNLGDSVQINEASDAGSGSSTPPRRSETLIPLIARLFPSLQTLNLAYNNLSNTSLAPEGLSTLILASPNRRGLKRLFLRGNRLSELDGFLGLAETFRSNRENPAWKMEELDLRDNEIGKLPAELGLMPLDVLLVDGNTFRVPQRRVWEREGTKGLLSWLRGRVE